MGEGFFSETVSSDPREMPADLENFLTGEKLSNFSFPSSNEIKSELHSNTHPVTMLEEALVSRLPRVKGTEILKNLNLIGIDGSSFSLRGHPFRIIIARSAVFSFSQRVENSLNIAKSHKGAIRIVLPNKTGDSIESELRRKEISTLAYIESKTATEIVDKVGVSNIDILYRDGPLYFREGFHFSRNSVKYLTDRGVPVVGVVKNSFSRRIMDALGYEGLLDSDFFSYFLNPGYRSSFFLINDVKINGKTRNLEKNLRQIFFYLITPKGMLIKVELPYWFYVEYNPKLIVKCIWASILIGEGNNVYPISKADSLARFSRYERRAFEERFKRISEDLGFKSPTFYNQMRWGSFSAK